jgi:NitT/TauT family transport system substrate-binding protein
MALKKSGIKKPADLNGKKLGAPVFDAGRRAFPIFAKANNIGNVNWTAMDPPLRETMLARRHRRHHRLHLHLAAQPRGARRQAEDVVVLPYPDYGVKLYGNVIIASPKLIARTRQRSRRSCTAFTKGAKDVMANPMPRPSPTSRRATASSTPKLETRRLKLAIDTVINSADARAEGFGQVNPGRLSLMASQVSDAFNTKTRVNPDAVWNGSFLPTKAELNIAARRSKRMK